MREESQNSQTFSHWKWRNDEKKAYILFFHFFVYSFQRKSQVGSTIRDRSNFSGYLRRVLGKICLKKSLRPLFLVEKKSSPPYFFLKKSLRPPIFSWKKVFAPPNFFRINSSPPFLFLQKTALPKVIWRMKSWILKFCSKKVFAPLIFFEKKVFAPLIFFEKSQRPLFSKKSLRLLPINFDPSLIAYNCYYIFVQLSIIQL